MRKGHKARLERVLQMDMTALLAVDAPAVRDQEDKYFATGQHLHPQIEIFHPFLRVMEDGFHG